MFAFDKTRLDLAREFRASPFGEHSPDLQYLLNLMRRPSDQPFYMLFVDKMNARWTLGVMDPTRRSPPQRTNVVFDDLHAAEWHVFKRRWAALAGEELPIA
jgi:N,N-dimethylformamidase